MVRPITVAALFVFVPLAPAGAVVAITAPARVPPAVTAVRSAAPVAKADVLGLTYGELAAALTGLAVVGLAIVGGRQPHSVTA